MIVTGTGIVAWSIVATRPQFPPLPTAIAFYLAVMISSYYYIKIRDTIVSFDIIIYFFLLLTFGSAVAACVAFVGVTFMWFVKNCQSCLSSWRQFREIMRVGLYNGGVYAIIYAVAGAVMKSFSPDLGPIIAIAVIVILNEIFFTVRMLIRAENIWMYFKEEGFVTDILEVFIYPFGISMATLYVDHGFGATIPFITGILLFSYIGYEMSRYQSEVKTRIDKEEEINEITRILESIISVEELIRTILKKVQGFLQAREVTLLLDYPEVGIYKTKTYDGRVIRDHPLTTYDGSDQIHELPLSTRERVIGSITVRTPEKLSNETIILLKNLVKTISLRLANAVLYKISIEDSLTGIYTRRFFEQKLVEGIQAVKIQRGVFAIVMFDIDRLKDINDELGHKCGDDVLIRFATILRSHSRKSDTIARWGGDEFVAVLPDATEQDAETFGRKIQDKLAREVFTAEHQKKSASVSFGVLEYSTTVDIDECDIFHEVDKRLLKMKKTSRR
jgi:diguanylate cyclase (GGDEF)-like protein